jgi:hypothetical protein
MGIKGDKGGDGGDEFNYDALQKLLQMSQCTPIITIIIKEQRRK